MTFEVVLGHVVAVATGGLDELVIEGVGGEAVVSALLVDVVENGRIHTRIAGIQGWVWQTACTCWGGGWGCSGGWRWIMDDRQIINLGRRRGCRWCGGCDWHGY